MLCDFDQRLIQGEDVDKNELARIALTQNFQKKDGQATTDIDKAILVDKFLKASLSKRWSAIKSVGIGR